jgi:hypothetical protein
VSTGGARSSVPDSEWTALSALGSFGDVQASHRFTAGQGTRGVRRVAYASGVALVVAGATVGVVVSLDHGAARSSTALAHREQVEEGETNLIRAKSRLEQAILTDARTLAGRGALNGPILGVSCTSMVRSASGNHATISSYNCLAIRRRRGRTLEGTRFLATIDASSGSYTFSGD